MYEIKYLLRIANIQKKEEIVMGKYSYILNNSGMLLRENMEYIINKKDAQKKLRNAKQFYDFIWELEVRTMLYKMGATVSFVEPNNKITYDGVATILGYEVPFECKNKIIDNEQYDTNLIFVNVLINKLQNVETLKNKIVEIEFEFGRLEDINTIVSVIEDKFDVFDYQSILGRYKVKTLKNIPFSTPPQILINRQGINHLFQISEVNKNEIYIDNAPSNVVKAKILVKIPEAKKNINNINNVLKKANQQLVSGGIVFLQVPYNTFEDTKLHLIKELSYNFSNISAVKLVAINIESYENQGVKVSRLEELILSQRSKRQLPAKVIAFLKQPMLFSKYS